MDEVVRRRRNGRLQACDPCRRQKLACDHARPCSRCVRKQKGDACVYTEQAPALKRFKPTTGPSVVSASSTSSGPLPTPPPPPPPRLSTGSTSSLDQSPSNGSAGGVGYLGFTSFDTVYEETRNSLSLLGAPERRSQDGTSNLQADLVAPERLPRIQALSLRVLRMIPSPKQGMHFPVDEPGCNHESWIYRSAQLIRDGLYATWSSQLSTERSNASLEEMASVISSNTASKTIEESADPETYFSQFTGPNLRWEAVGVMLVHWLRWRRTSHRQQLQAANDCVVICSELSPRANAFLLHLHLRRCVVQSMVTGDSSLELCRHHAQVVSMVTFGGLHVESLPPGHHRPPLPLAPTTVTTSLPIELRRRSLWMFFTLDKVQVAFTGRPPGLPRHYVTTSLPLDLDDSDLFADEATLAHAVATKLDSRGWNTTGHVHATSMIRARALTSLLLDEAFEIALGSQAATVSLARLLDLRSRTEATYAELPERLKYHVEDRAEDRLTFSKVIIRIEHLQCLFILDRLIQKRFGHHHHHHQPGGGSGSSVADLLGVSYEMTSIVVSLWTRMDKFNDEKNDFAWVVMGYGAPAGGVLCLELLRPSVSMGGSGSPITRSGITQTLSLLVGFLDWVDKGQANGDICARTKDTIQQVLDQALNGNTMGVGHAYGNASVGGGGGGGGGGVEGVPSEGLWWDVGNQFDFNFDLMDTFDWLRSEPSLSQEQPS